MTIQITFSLFRYFVYPLTKIWSQGPHLSLSQVWLKLFLESRLSPLEKQYNHNKAECPSAKFGGNKHYCCFCFGEVYKSLAISFTSEDGRDILTQAFFILNDPMVLEKKIVYPNNDDIQEISFSFDGNSSKWLHMKIYNIYM